MEKISDISYTNLVGSILRGKVQASCILSYYCNLELQQYTSFYISLKFFTTCYVCLQLIFWNDDASSV